MLNWLKLEQWLVEGKTIFHDTHLCIQLLKFKYV